MLRLTRSAGRACHRTRFGYFNKRNSRTYDTYRTCRSVRCERGSAETEYPSKHYDESHGAF